MTMALYQVVKSLPKIHQFRQGETMPGHFQERSSREQPQSALQMTGNNTESGRAQVRSTDTMAAELKLQDTHINPGSSVCSGSAIESSSQTPGQPSQPASQAAEGGNTIYNSATSKIAKDTVVAAVGEQIHDRAKRDTSPAGSTSEGGHSNTLRNESDVADAHNDAANHATRLKTLLARLPKLEIADKDTGRGAVHCEQEHDHANVAATPEDSIFPKIEAPPGIPENETEEIISRFKGDGPSASRLKVLLSTLDPADQDSDDSDGPPRTGESTGPMTSPSTSPSLEHDAVYFGLEDFPEDLLDSISATAGMKLIREGSH
ncbi:hypothetical protein LMH87_001490 [Akanthomyces muscarius]|uniref:Uncharacterized protein n=1 Tax=Akanthomyces muscarius TaxID=2231603 RepID=A0A9W8Q6V8_AKAMU|nr:hypothetical protein LMH87_001490 [Akanthomyces muscarius]KAJ4146936.1 hypothetical protein LMH87_001490 [Akanthomyces muscarius]